MEWWEYAVTQGFGPTNEPLDSGWGGYPHFNKGIDFGVPMGTPIRSIITGTVVAAGPGSDGWGTRVQIRDPDGNIHNFGHLSAADVQVGQQVLRGQIIGASGNTGASTGPHLSYDVWNYANGTINYIDPSAYVAGAPGASAMTMFDPENQPAPNAAEGSNGGPQVTLPDGTGYSQNPVTGGVTWYKQNSLGDWEVVGGLGQPYNGPPSIRHDANGNAFEWKNGSWVATPEWNKPASATGNTTLREMFNPQTGQRELAVVDTKTGQVVSWGAQTQGPQDRYYTIPATAAPNARAQSTLAPLPRETGGLNINNPNRVDALSIANSITGRLGGQSFNQQSQDGRLTQAQFDLASKVAANQQGNSNMILQAYGIDTSKADYRDPIKAAAAASFVGARQQALIDNGFSPTQAQSIIMMENSGGGSASMQLPMSTPIYNSGQTVMVGPDGHTYSEAAYRQAFG